MTKSGLRIEVDDISYVLKKDNHFIARLYVGKKLITSGECSNSQETAVGNLLLKKKKRFPFIKWSK